MVTLVDGVDRIDPYVIWGLFFTTEMIGKLCTVTNACDIERERENWKNVDGREILIYFAI